MKKLVQKLIGLALIGIGLIIPALMDGDATVSLLVIPLGLFILLTKETVIY